MTKAEKSHMGRVAEIGCILCKQISLGETQAELHHPRTGTGAGRRASHFDVIPLCPEHHRGNSGLHGMGRKAFEKYYGITELQLLEKVTECLR
jgi:hypothetical protein